MEARGSRHHCQRAVTDRVFYIVGLSVQVTSLSIYRPVGMVQVLRELSAYL
jgi:hypothetical protein